MSQQLPLKPSTLIREGLSQFTCSDWISKARGWWHVCHVRQVRHVCKFGNSGKSSNPLNPRTVVPFYPAYNGQTTITVYNLLGQRVPQTEAGFARGAHDIEIQLGDYLAQGPYLLNVRGDGFSETRTMTFVSAGVGGRKPAIRVRAGVSASQ